VQNPYDEVVSITVKAVERNARLQTAIRAGMSEIDGVPVGQILAESLLDQEKAQLVEIEQRLGSVQSGKTEGLVIPEGFEESLKSCGLPAEDGFRPCLEEMERNILHTGDTTDVRLPLLAIFKGLDTMARNTPSVTYSAAHRVNTLNPERTFGLANAGIFRTVQDAPLPPAPQPPNYGVILRSYDPLGNALAGAALFGGGGAAIGGVGCGTIGAALGPPGSAVAAGICGVIGGVFGGGIGAGIGYFGTLGQAGGQWQREAHAWCSDQANRYTMRHPQYDDLCNGEVADLINWGHLGP
jgi:hypothetical protein